MPEHPPIPVAFLNENTLGHGSYLPRFIAELNARPELGIRPIRIDAVPMAPRLQRRADRTLPGLRKVGLDFHIARWRRVVSRETRRRLDAEPTRPRAVVLNTQSVGLDLPSLEVPLLVCLDATFEQLRRTPWFAPNPVARWLSPLTLAPILGSERRLFQAAWRLLPWSVPARESLLRDYALPPGKVEILPPSLDPASLCSSQADRERAPGKPQVLFLGGNFQRKGGPLVCEAFRRFLQDRFELHLVTQSDVPEQPGIRVHRNVTAGSDAWRQRWREASVFVFPSTLETFGIVLLEALAFGVPVVASRAGAAVDILENGRNGLLLERATPECLAAAIRSVLDAPEAAAERVAAGRRRIAQDFDLSRNTARLAEMIHEAIDQPGRFIPAA